MEKPENLNKDDLTIYGGIYLSYVSHRHVMATIDKIDQQVRESIRHILNEDNKGFLLMGPVGCGKTSILAIALKSYLKKLEIELTAEIEGYNKIDSYTYVKGQNYINLRKRADFLYCTHDEIVNYLRRWKQTTNDDEVICKIPDYLTPGRVFIDDFGRIFSDRAGWNLSLQEEYFDYLWRNNVRVYVTTNLTPTQFQKEIKANGDWARIYDRLFDKSWVSRIVMTNESKRG